MAKTRVKSYYRKVIGRMMAGSDKSHDTSAIDTMRKTITIK